MQSRDHEPINKNDMRCSQCGRPYESTTIIENGQPTTYLQCWQCFTSIKLRRFEPREGEFPCLGYRPTTLQNPNENKGKTP